MKAGRGLLIAIALAIAPGTFSLPAVAQTPYTIPVKILADDKEPTVQSVWAPLPFAVLSFLALLPMKYAGLADPPPFVKSKKDLEPGAKAYRKLARLAADVTAPGGFVMVASCSHNIAPERFAQECAQGLQRVGRRAALI